MVGCNPGGGSAVTPFMGTRFTKILLLSALAAVQTGGLVAQCPQFLGTEVVADLPATAASPHWFQCIGSVTADPGPFTFELTAQPATHTGVVIDWGDGSPAESIGNWDGSTPIAHGYTPDEWRNYTITVTTTACPTGAFGTLVYEPETPGAGLVYGDSNAGCAPFIGLPRIDVNLAFSPNWSFSLDWGDGTAPDTFTMEQVLNDATYDTLKFVAGSGDEIVRISGMSHTYQSQNCSMGNCDHDLTLIYSNFCSVRGASTPYVPGGTIVGTGYNEALLGNAFLTWDVDEAEIQIADPVVCWPNNETSVGNASCPDCCDASSGNNVAGNGTVRTEKWDFGGATYIGSGPDPTNWIDWNGDCASGQFHALSFPGPGVYTMTLFTQNHCGIDTVTRDITVAPPPTVTATSSQTSLCPGEPFQFETVGWSADPPLTADDLSFNFTYGDGPFSITIAMVGGLIPFENIPAQPGNVYSAAGNYDATVQVFPTLSPSCLGAAVIPVTVLTPPTADFTLPPDACEAEATIQPVDASTDALDYAWSLSGVGPIGTSAVVDPVTLSGPGNFTFDLTVTSSNGCSDSQSRTFALADLPVADFAVEDACLGVPTVLDGTPSSTDAAFGGAIVSHQWTLGDGSVLSGDTQTVDYGGPGSQTVELIVTTAAGCADTLSQTFEILPRPAVGLLEGDTIGCSPFTVELNALDSTGITTPSSFTWDYGHGGATGPDADGTHTWPPNNGEDTLYYDVIVEAGLGGCTSTDQLTVAVAPSPFVQTDGGEVCSGNPFLFEGNAFNLGDNPEWFWEVDPVWSPVVEDYGTITSDFDDFQWTFVNPGLASDTVSIAVTVTRPNGCSATDLASLYVRPSYAPFVEDADGCVPFAVGTPPQVALEVQWDFGDVNNPNAPGATAHFYTEPGTYTVVAEGISVFGCAGSDSSTVIVHPTPTPALTAEDALCAPDPVNPVRSDAAADGASSWSLQVDLGTIYPWNGATDTTLALEPGNHLLTLIATSDEGCVGETSAEVLVQDEVTAGFTLPLDGCSPVAFGVTGVDIPVNAVATWTIDTPFGTDTVQTVAPSAPDWLTDPTVGSTTYAVVLDVEDPLTGCTAQHTDSITVLPQPVGEMSVAGLSGCDVIATFAYSGTADALTWTFGDPFDPAPETTTATSISHAYPNPLGTGYTATATVTASIGTCTDTDQVSFDIPAIVEAEISLPDTVCMGTSVPLENLSTGVPLAMGIASGAWTWTVGNDTLVGFEPALPPLDSTTVNAGPQTNAILPVTLTIVHPESGCSDETDATIVVLGNPVASFIATPDALFEEPYTTNLIDLNQVAAGGATLWSVSGGGELDEATGSVTWPVNTHGIQTITVVLDNNGCTDTFSQEVLLVPPPPFISFVGDTTSCAPLQASFDPSIIGVVDSVVWSFGQGITRVVQDQPEDPIGFGYFEPGTYTVGVTAYGPGGTAVAETQTVVVLDQVNAGFSIFPAECVEVGDVVEFTPNFNYDGAVYSWQFGDGSELESPEGAIVTHTYTESGSPIITLTIQNALCSDSTSRVGCIIEFQGGSVGVPSAFTPTFGGDGSGAQNYGDDDLRDNDVFFPQIDGTTIAYSFTIYNRWGEQIFSTSDPSVGWNGHFQGKLCKQDVYVWRVAAVFIDGTSVEQAGDVTLIRR